MKKWSIEVWGNDGRKFYQNFHVIEATAETAKLYLLENLPDSPARATLEIQKVEILEDADLYLPGIVYKSGKAYFA